MREADKCTTQLLIARAQAKQSALAIFRSVGLIEIDLIAIAILQFAVSMEYGWELPLCQEDFRQTMVHPTPPALSSDRRIARRVFEELGVVGDARRRRVLHNVFLVVNCWCP